MSGGVVVPTRQPSLGALRQRRDAANKPGLSRISTRASTVDAIDISSRISDPVPLVRTAEYTLRKFAGAAPSLIIHLHVNYFRFDQQDGNLPYNSPIVKCFMKHLKEKTVPHDLVEEFFSNGVNFYDGALIIEVHNHRNSSGNSGATTNQVGGTSDDPFSIHNWNEHIIPSGSIKLSDLMVKMSKIDKPATTQSNAADVAMPAPEVPASASRPKGPTVITTVLFPSALSMEAERQLLATIPIDNFASSKSIYENGLPHPQTPLASVPPTPIIANPSNPSKPTKMFLDEDTVKDFEAAVLRLTEPTLYLEPAKDFDHSLAIMETLRHPLHDISHSRPKTRKRTIAEVAAEEEDAAKEVRFILNGDERQIAALGTGPGTANNSNEGQSGSAGGFKRFKTLEAIKLKHDKLKQEASEKEDQERREKATRDALELEQKKKEKMLEQQRMLAQQAKLKHQQETNAQQLKMQAQQQQAQMQAAHQAQVLEAAQANQIANGVKNVAVNGQRTPITTAAMTPQMAQVSGMHMSPVVRQMTPMSASPIGDGQNMSAMTSVPMAATASNTGAGSPGMMGGPQQLANGIGMARNMSQQPVGHPGSNMGTPQMSGTPRMGSVGPAQRMTPQPNRMQGSPLPGQHQSTPMMMTASQGANLSAEARVNLMRQQQQAAARQQQMMANGQMANGHAMQNMQGMQSMQQMQQMQNFQNLQNMQNMQNMQNNLSGLEHLPPQQRMQVLQQLQARQQQNQQMQQAGLVGAQQNGMAVQGAQSLPGSQQAQLLLRKMQAQAQGLSNPQLMQVVNNLYKKFQELETNSRAGSNSRRQAFMAQFQGNVPPNQMQEFHKNETSILSDGYAKYISFANQNWTAAIARIRQMQAQQAMANQAQQQGQMQQQQSGMQMAGMHQMNQGMMQGGANTYQQQLQQQAQQAHLRQSMMNMQRLQQHQQQQQAAAAQQQQQQQQQNGMHAMQGMGGMPMQQQMSMMGMQGHMGQPNQPGMPGQHGMGT